MSIFLQLKKDSDGIKQSSRLSKEKVKKRLIDSVDNNANINTEELNKCADRVKGYEEATNIIKEYREIIKTNKNNIVFIAYQQGKENRKFKSLVEQFKITKVTIIFKNNFVKLVEKYPKMMTSSVTLNF